jgi:hypothetical protein
MTLINELCVLFGNSEGKGPLGGFEVFIAASMKMTVHHQSGAQIV